MNEDPALPVSSSSPAPSTAAAVPPEVASPLDDPALAAIPAIAVAAKGPSFAELGLRPDVIRAIEEMGFTEPMPVQAATYPLLMAGRDIMVQSRTGSGKTAAFGIPFANGLVNPEDKFVQAIVLLPTRELALQVASELAKICAHQDITVVPVYGGAPMGRQVEQLRAGGQIVCGTPGRILDHLRRGTLRLERVRSAVLDECDEMLSMGFQEDIEAILERTPAERQTLLFSATVPEGIQRLSRRFMRQPEFLKLSGDFIGVHEIKHLYYSIPALHRENELLQILAFEDPRSAIIFCNTREETSRVAAFLRQHGHDAEAISSDLAQNDRERVLGRMRAGGIKFLVATDVAARGIDIENLSHVFNYTFPEAPEIYIHRTGRTGRAGRQGTAVSLIGPTEVGSFYYLKLLYKIKPDERALPSETEIRSHREGERILVLRRQLANDPGGDWRALARRLIGAVDGERLVAALLAHSFASVEGMPVVAPPPPPPRPAAPVEARAASSQPREREPYRAESRDRPRYGDRDRERGRSGGGERDRPRDRPRFGERVRSEPRAGESRGAPRGETREDPTAAPRGDAPGESRNDARPETRSERGGETGGEARGETRGETRNDARSAPRAPLRSERQAPRPLRNDQPPQEREFWEVWSEERAQAASTSDASAGAGETVADRIPTEPGASPDVDLGSTSRPSFDDRPRNEPPPGDVARLYLNLGRKDGASEREIRELLSEHAAGVQLAEADVMNTHTYLNVAPADADRVCAALTGKELAGRPLVCEPARPRRDRR